MTRHAIWPATLAAAALLAACGSSSGSPSGTSGRPDPALRFADCMRSHGVTNFPDPTRNAPKGITRVLALRGMLFVLGPGLDPRSPAFKQAASACGIRLP